MPQNQITSELTTTNGFPDGAVFEAIVGDSINLNPLVTIGTPTITLVQKPSGSTASVSSGSFSCDLAGVYLATLANGGIARSFCFYCFAAATLNQKVAGGPNTVNRNHLRALVAGAGPLAAGGTNALRTVLEGSSPTNLGVTWSAYGN
ncbi:MAG: hypothetical protein ABTD50_19385 [Polyangiaceae bacterium]|jgi:hypothetical protein